VTVPRTYVVSAAEGREYRVILTASAEGWKAEVERDGKRWTFAVEPGPSKGLVRVEDRPRRWRWDGASGRLFLDGDEHTLQAQTETEHRLTASSTETPKNLWAREIHAPMPGLVLAVEVAEEELVAAGKGLVIIEAMKMENEITAPEAGIVRGIGVTVGQAVERGALLCRIEPRPEAGA
jgi:biotin carboxyl carrier protein